MRKKSSKIYFLLTKEQWIGVVILAVIVGSLFFLLHRFQPEEVPSALQVNDSVISNFTKHQAQQDSLYQAQWKKKYPRDTIAIRLQPFDPNTADSSTLVHLGLKKWQASNMLKYRAKGGRYQRPEDLKRLYGMNDSIYQTLLPYIVIDTMAVKQYKDSVYRQRKDSLAAIRDSAQAAYDSLPKYVSHKRDTLLNIRTADTTELKMIRGIGSYRAKQIIRYRNQLGGFVAVEQLKEIKALDPLFADSIKGDSLLASFFIDSIIVQPLLVNSMRVESLQRHPYLSFEQARAIYEFRRKKIRIDSIEQLSALDCLSKTDIERLSPYLDFTPRRRD